MKACAPSNNDLLRVNFVVEIVHRAVVLHVHRDLYLRLAMKDGERRADLYFTIIRTGSKEGSNNAFLSICSAEIVIQDGEEGHWVHRDRGRSAPKKT